MCNYRLTSPIKSAKVSSKKSRCALRSRKELIMTIKNAINMNTLPVMGSSYYYFTKARFFAGLFGVLKNQFCQIRN